MYALLCGQQGSDSCSIIFLNSHLGGYITELEAVDKDRDMRGLLMSQNAGQNGGMSGPRPFSVV